MSETFDIQNDTTSQYVLPLVAVVVTGAAAVYLANQLRPLEDIKKTTSVDHAKAYTDAIYNKIHQVVGVYHRAIEEPGNMCPHDNASEIDAWVSSSECPEMTLASNASSKQIYRTISKISCLLVLVARYKGLILDYHYPKKPSATSVTVLINDFMEEFFFQASVANSPYRKEDKDLATSEKEVMNKTLKALELFYDCLLDDFQNVSTNSKYRGKVMDFLFSNKEEIKHFRPLEFMSECKAIEKEGSFLIRDDTSDIYVNSELLMEKLYSKNLDCKMNSRYKEFIDVVQGHLDSIKQDSDKAKALELRYMVKQALSFAVDAVLDVHDPGERLERFNGIALASI